MILALSIGITMLMSPEVDSVNPDPISDVIFSYLLYGSLCFLIYKLAKMANLDWYSLIGEMKIDYLTSKYILIIIPLIAVSFAGIFLIYFPVSFLYPRFVTGWVIDDQINIFWNEGINYKLANLLNFFSISLIGPVVEEIFFRGFLLTSLANKWNINKGIFLSSIAFGIFHIDVLGSFIFGVVVAILYLKTNSLYVPIIIHISNNTVGYIAYYFFASSGESTIYTLTDFQGDWWIGLIGLIIGLQWLIAFYKREIFNNSFTIPYFNKI